MICPDPVYIWRDFCMIQSERLHRLRRSKTSRLLEKFDKLLLLKHMRSIADLPHIKYYLVPPIVRNDRMLRSSSNNRDMNPAFKFLHKVPLNNADYLSVHLKPDDFSDHDTRLVGSQKQMVYKHVEQVYSGQGSEFVAVRTEFLSPSC